MPTGLHPARNLIYGAVFLFIVTALGICGYMAAGWSMGDALYMLVLTTSTVGFDEVHPVNTPFLRGLTMTAIILGSTGMIFMTGALVQFFTALQIQQVFGINRMKNEIAQLRDHIIVCGYGRIGNMLLRELRAANARFVLLDRSEQRIAEARAAGYLCMQGDAADETTLIAAGVERARILATVLPDDAANVFITLSARSLNKSLQIIARGEMPTTEGKLIHAGADRVVLPTHIGAERIAEMILYQETSRFLRSEKMSDLERDLRKLGLELEVITAAGSGAFAGLSVDEVDRRAGGAFLVVAINRLDGGTINRPPGSTMVEAGDGLVVLGRSGRMGRFE
ncbi:MAG: potassium channel protein [Nevskia sp.]|nr:potassium channel protein [Nevskia sp.]